MSQKYSIPDISIVIMGISYEYDVKNDFVGYMEPNYEELDSFKEFMYYTKQKLTEYNKEELVNQFYKWRYNDRI